MPADDANAENPRAELPIGGDLLYIELQSISGTQLHYLGQVAQEHTLTHTQTYFIYIPMCCLRLGFGGAAGQGVIGG